MVRRGVIDAVILDGAFLWAELRLSGQSVPVSDIVDLVKSTSRYPRVETVAQSYPGLWRAASAKAEPEWLRAKYHLCGCLHPSDTEI